jgi:hypothetical protein
MVYSLPAGRQVYGLWLLPRLKLSLFYLASLKFTIDDIKVER